MPRTILEIAIEAAERDATAPAPQKLFDTNDRVARILRQAAKDTFREYLRTSGWQGLSESFSTWVFELVPGRFAYPLPPDFLRIIPNTEQRNGWPLGLIGPATPQAWSAWVHGGAAIASPMGWRIKNNALWIEPTPKSHELVVIEYVSRYPVTAEVSISDFDMRGRVTIAKAPLVPRDGHLVLEDYKTVNVSGEGDGHYDQEPGYDVALWGSDPLEALRRLNPLSRAAPLPEVRKPEFSADSDKPVFDDDYLMSIGMTFRLRRALGLPFTEHAAEYEEELAIKGASDAGGAREFRLGSSGYAGGVLPLGGGRWMVD